MVPKNIKAYKIVSPLVLIAGSLLPWMKAIPGKNVIPFSGEIIIYGYDEGGMIIVAIGLILLLLALLGKTHSRFQRIYFVAGGTASGLSLLPRLITMTGTVSGYEITTLPGLYVVILGTIFCVLTGLLISSDK